MKKKAKAFFFYAQFIDLQLHFIAPEMLFVALTLNKTVISSYYIEANGVRPSHAQFRRFAVPGIRVLRTLLFP
ncbi:MAG: hypothetical protein E7233_07155 [Lachnospiraceae bacterium]|nr:hypothetical protein [Lachnospiraceae bacterium]